MGSGAITPKSEARRRDTRSASCLGKGRRQHPTQLYKTTKRQNTIPWRTFLIGVRLCALSPRPEQVGWRYASLRKLSWGGRDDTPTQSQPVGQTNFNFAVETTKFMCAITWWLGSAVSSARLARLDGRKPLGTS